MNDRLKSKCSKLERKIDRLEIQLEASKKREAKQSRQLSKMAKLRDENAELRAELDRVSPGSVRFIEQKLKRRAKYQEQRPRFIDIGGES
jgi:hypothetical protein